MNIFISPRQGGPFQAHFFLLTWELLYRRGAQASVADVHCILLFQARFDRVSDLASDFFQGGLKCF